MNIFQRKSTESIFGIDDSLTVLNEIFSMARYIGICNYGRNKFFAWTLIVLFLLTTIEVCAIWKLIKCLTGIATNTNGGRGLIGRLSGAIFYGNALLSLVLSLKFISSWSEISIYWFKLDTNTCLRLPLDLNIRRRIILLSSFVFIVAVVEHVMSMISATGLDCPIEEYLHRYILVSHGFLLQAYEYKITIAIPLFVMSKVATLIWNFQDLIIIMISMGLTSRYHRLNMYLRQTIKIENKNKNIQKLGTDSYIQLQVWRRIREGYVRQAALVRLVNMKLGPLILLSNVNNLYFICLQLFLGIGNLKADFIHAFYYFLSLSWLLLRACSVVIAASDVYEHSRKALPSLYRCPSTSYNIEVKRLINQLTNDMVVLTGMGLFNLRRQLLLQVAATILKYELVIIQYDSH